MKEESRVNSEAIRRESLAYATDIAMETTFSSFFERERFSMVERKCSKLGAPEKKREWRLWVQIWRGLESEEL